MLIPRFWAEAKAHRREGKRRLTVKRFGWSRTSQVDAQAMADARAQEALERIWQGEAAVARTEPKVPYHGAEGMPIREEILAEHGRAVITRNSYGAHCLNVPDVLFADVDLPPFRPKGQKAVIGVGCLAFTLMPIGFLMGSYPVLVTGFGLLFVGMLLDRWQKRTRKGVVEAHYTRERAAAKARIEAFAAAHVDWHLRVYETPNGWRVLAAHRTFAPNDPVVGELFAALDTDPMYVAMCRAQQCFRARLTGKPWRMGMLEHLRPRPGVWPVSDYGMPIRQKWVAEYEPIAAQHAACRYHASYGSTVVHPEVGPIIALHDEASRAYTKLPLA